MKSYTKSCRFSESTAKQIEEAAQACGVLQSDIFRRAIRYYIRSNPDKLPVLSGDNNSMNNGGISVKTPVSGGTGNRDTTARRNSTGSSDENVSLSGVYDPSKEDV